MVDRFAADLDALLRDPCGVDVLAAVDPRAGRATIAAGDFLAARGGHELLAPAAPDGLVAATRELALSSMAEAWAGAVATWHETQADLRSRHAPGLGPQDEAELLRRLAACWPPEDGAAPAAALGDLGPQPVAYASALCADEPFRYGFEGAVARVAEIGARLARVSLLLRMTLPGRPVVVAGDDRELAATLGRLRRDRPQPFIAPLEPITTAPMADPADRVCCFARGEQLIACACIGDRATGACGWDLPAWATGSWRELLSGVLYELPAGATLAGVAGSAGLAVLVPAG